MLAARRDALVLNGLAVRPTRRGAWHSCFLTGPGLPPAASPPGAAALWQETRENHGLGNVYCESWGKTDP